MHKHEIINFINEAHASHKLFIDGGQILIDGINLDRVDEPVTCDDCHFSHWINSNTNIISNFTWFEDLKKLHVNLHNKYSVLFYESMRKYNPKTFEQLLKRFDALKDDANLFTEKLNEIEIEMLAMTEEEFNTLASNKSKKSDVILKNIDIDQYEEENETQVDINSNSHEEIITEETQVPFVDEDTVTSNIIISNKSAESKNANIEPTFFIEASKIEEENDNVDNSINFSGLSHSADEENIPKSEVTNSTIFSKSVDRKEFKVSHDNNNSETIIKHISLKEQHLEQLQQDKELSKLELDHLEATQQLTLKSSEQLEKSFNLKQQGIELEKSDNHRLINFKNDARKNTLEDLNEITDSTEDLKQELVDLEKLILEDEIKQENNKSSATIAKQFEELKHNKHKDLDRLQGHLQIRKVDLKQLKDQMLLLENEIAEMETDISKKKEDMTDLKEKEKTKNEERAAQKEEYERVLNEHQDLIKEKQFELDALLLQVQEKQTELAVIDFQVEELDKNNEFLDKNNSDVLADLDRQQVKKQEKIIEINSLKESKQSEISAIESSISKAEESLQEMKSSLSQKDDELAIAD